MGRKIHKTALESSVTRNFPIEKLCNLLRLNTWIFFSNLIDITRHSYKMYIFLSTDYNIYRDFQWNRNFHNNRKCEILQKTLLFRKS